MYEKPIWNAIPGHYKIYPAHPNNFSEGFVHFKDHKRYLNLFYADAGEKIPFPEIEDEIAVLQSHSDPSSSSFTSVSASQILRKRKKLSSLFAPSSSPLSAISPLSSKSKPEHYSKTGFQKACRSFDSKL